MSDLTNGSFFKLSPYEANEIAPVVAPLLIEAESVVAAFKGTRTFVVFTDKRLIAVDVRGLTGKRHDFTSLPYSRIQAFSVEATDTFDLDPQLDLWFSGIGKIRLDFKGTADIRQIAQLIARSVL
jgi:Bacterial PH domain